MDAINITITKHAELSHSQPYEITVTQEDAKITLSVSASDLESAIARVPGVINAWFELQIAGEDI